MGALLGSAGDHSKCREGNQPTATRRSAQSSPVSANSNGKTLRAEREVEIAAVLGLEPFERFVYAMTVLERYSDQECSFLLGCARRDVLAARSRALQQIGSVIELQRQQPLANPKKPIFDKRCGSALELVFDDV